MEFIHSLSKTEWRDDKENRSLQTDSGFPLKSTDQCAVNGAVPRRRRTLVIIQSMVSPNRRRRDRSRSPQRREEGYHDHRRRRHRESEGDYGRWASKIPF